MNKILIALIAIGILIAVGAGAYLVMNRNTANPQSTTETSQQTQMESTEKKSLRDLMTLANNQQCTFTDTESNSSGTVYVANGKVRGDFDSSVQGTTLKAHMIADSENVYVWMDGSTDGFKTSLAASESMAAQIQESIDLNKAVDYNCNDWSADEAVFAVPSNINFKDYSSVMIPSGTGTADTDAKTMQCQACNSLPADAAAQCKTALGCN